MCVWSQVVCRFLCEEATETLTEKQFVPAVRKFIIKQLLAGFPLFKSFSFISLYSDFTSVLYKMYYMCVVCVCVIQVD